MIFAHSAATLLMPIPFVGDAIEQSMMDSKSESYRSQYLNIDIQKLATDAFSSSDLYSKVPTEVQIHPVAYVQECIDDVFRISLAIHLESKN